jgi:hypothetical protein
LFTGDLIFVMQSNSEIKQDAFLESGGQTVIEGSPTADNGGASVSNSNGSNSPVFPDASIEQPAPTVQVEDPHLSPDGEESATQVSH